MTHIVLKPHVDAAYRDTRAAIAAGETRDEARNALIDGYPMLEPDVIGDVLYDAHRDAVEQGVDPDESWSTY